jgi:hypothetical protein
MVVLTSSDRLKCAAMKRARVRPRRVISGAGARCAKAEKEMNEQSRVQPAMTKGMQHNSPNERKKAG